MKSISRGVLASFLRKICTKSYIEEEYLVSRIRGENAL